MFIARQMFESSIKPALGGMLFSLQERLRREEFNREWGLFTSAKWVAILLFKQPKDGINFPEITRIQSEKAQACEFGGDAAEDQKEI